MTGDATRFLFKISNSYHMFGKMKQNQSHFSKNYVPGWPVNIFLISRRCIKTDKFGSFSVAFNYNRPSYIMKDKGLASGKRN